MTFCGYQQFASSSVLSPLLPFLLMTAVFVRHPLGASITSARRVVRRNALMCDPTPSSNAWFAGASSLEIYADYIFEGNTQKIPCVPQNKALAAKIDNPFFMWVDVYGNALANGRYQVVTGGDLRITDVVTDDIQRVKCVMSSSSPGTSRAEIETAGYDHIFLAYHLAEVYKDFAFVFRAPLCDKYNLERQLREMNQYLCVGSSQCIFQVTIEYCNKVAKNDQAASAKLYESLFRVRKKPSLAIELKRGTGECLLKLARYDLDQAQNNRVVGLISAVSDTYPELTGFVFVKNKLKVNYTAVCSDGYFVFKDIFCVPCTPGMSRKEGELQCSYCPRGSYQGNFAAAECQKCPRYGSTDDTGMTDIKYCKDFWETTYGITWIIIVAVVIVVIFLLCYFKLGWLFCPRLYKRMQKRKDRQTMRNPQRTVYDTKDDQKSNKGDSNEKGTKTARYPDLSAAVVPPELKELLQPSVAADAGKKKEPDNSHASAEVSKSEKASGRKGSSSAAAVGTAAADEMLTNALKQLLAPIGSSPLDQLLFPRHAPSTAGQLHPSMYHQWMMRGRPRYYGYSAAVPSHGLMMQGRSAPYRGAYNYNYYVNARNATTARPYQLAVPRYR